MHHTGLMHVMHKFSESKEPEFFHKCLYMGITVLSHCQMKENLCSNHEIHILFEHGFQLYNEP